MAETKQIDYTTSQLEDSIRRSLTPYVLSGGFIDGQTYTHPAGGGNMTANVKENIPIVSTPLMKNGFELNDFGGGDIAFQFQGENAGWYKLNISVSLTASENNVITDFGLLVNGAIPAGGDTQRKIGTGTDVGSFSVSTTVWLEPLDRVDFFGLVDIACAVTLKSYGFSLVEVN